MTKYEFHFDFGSPNAYLSHRVIPDIEERQGVTIEYIPVLLGGLFKATGNASPAITLAGIKNKPEYQSLEMQRFMKKHGITEFAMNPNFPVNTLQIMRGAIVAQDEGIFEKYVDVVYKAMWEDGKKMDDPEVIVTTLNEAGLDGAHILERTQEPDIKAKLVDNTSASVERGNFGSPSFYCGEELFFGKDRLRDFEEMIEETK